MHSELPKADVFTDQIFDIANKEDFEKAAIRQFHFQYEKSPVYRSFCEQMRIDKDQIRKSHQIPFLPISFFKTHKVQTTQFIPECIFESSGTTGSTSSRHLIKDIAVYEKSFFTHFHSFYGSPKNYCILALLPSYQQKGNSSLVYMVKRLMEVSGHETNHFYLNNVEALYDALLKNEKNAQKTLLIGVTYALLDFADAFPFPLQHTIVMETGGMKGRKKEQVRSEVHQQLLEKFRLQQIHSEYGMTELLSQAYSTGSGLFRSPPWMQVFIREEDDPRVVIHNPETPKSGALNIIDLANVYSCSFIATEDVGKLYPDGRFEVLGRIDNSDIRGCSLLAV